MNRNFIYLIMLFSFAILLPFLVWGPWSWCSYGMAGMMGLHLGWGFMILVPLTFLALIALGAYIILTQFIETTDSIHSREKEILEMLQKRYARGEITREEYLKMKGDLGFDSE